MTELGSFSGRIRVSPDVLRQELDGESVILDINSGCYFGLDTVGNRMWNALLNHDSIEEAYRELEALYDVDEQQLRADLQELLNQLLDRGLLETNET